jgi:hypothetical protein
MSAAQREHAGSRPGRQGSRHERARTEPARRNSNVLAFLGYLGGRPELVQELKTRSKDEVIAVAAERGYPFAAADFDAVVWDAEARLADRRGEPFDGHFSLWSTLWGRHYLEMLVEDLVPALSGGRSR